MKPMKLSQLKINRLIRLGLGVLGAVTVTLMLEKPAEASLIICNGTNRQVATAVGYWSNGRWFAKGWWRLGQDKCATVIGGNLNHRYYYIHAHYTRGDRYTWDGRYTFCVSRSAFNLEATNNCHESEKFFQVHVGNYRNYTYTLCPSSSRCLMPSPEIKYTGGGRAEGIDYSTDPETSFSRGLTLEDWGDLEAARQEFWYAAWGFYVKGQDNRRAAAMRKVNELETKLWD